LIDCHLHVGPEYDDWRTAPLAAARTGLTTLLPFVVYDDGESVPAAVKRLREEAEALSVLDFGMHMILNHEPHVLDGLAEAVTLGVSSFKLFMTYKKRPKRMVSDEFIAKTMERLAALGGLCQLHCENGDVLCYLEDKAIAAGRTAPTDFPATCPTGRRRKRSTARSSSAASPAAPCTSSISPPSSASSASSALTPRASGCGPRRARSTCC